MLKYIVTSTVSIVAKLTQSSFLQEVMLSCCMLQSIMMSALLSIYLDVMT